MEVFCEVDCEFGVVVGEFGDVGCDDDVVDWCFWMVVFEQFEEVELFVVVFFVY